MIISVMEQDPRAESNRLMKRFARQASNQLNGSGQIDGIPANQFFNVLESYRHDAFQTHMGETRWQADIAASLTNAFAVAYPQVEKEHAIARVQYALRVLMGVSEEVLDTVSTHRAARFFATFESKL